MLIPPLETTAVDKTSTLGGHPKNIKETPWSTLMDYLNDMQPYVKGEMYNMWKEGGEPYLDLYDDLDRAASFRLSESPRKSLFDYISSPDTMRIERRDIGDFLAEVSHAIQFNKPQSVRDSLDFESSRQIDLFGSDKYGIHGPQDALFYPALDDYGRYRSIKKYIPGETKISDIPMEMEAHEVIEPELNARLYKAIFGEELN